MRPEKQQALKLIVRCAKFTKNAILFFFKYKHLMPIFYSVVVNLSLFFMAFLFTVVIP